MQPLRERYRKAQFMPGFLGLFINPFYFARRELWRSFSSLSGYITGKTLDVGCGQKPYEHLFRSSEYIGLEIDSPENRADKKADFFYEGALFPFADEEYDSIVCHQVLEHVFNPALFLSEIHRVLKYGGYFLLSVPFVWDEHEQPFDYARYSSYGLRYLLKKYGFEIIEQKKTSTDIRVICQMINAYIYKVIVSKNVYANLFFTLILMSPFNILGEILWRILPQNNDLFLDNIILARK